MNKVSLAYAVENILGVLPGKLLESNKMSTFYSARNLPYLQCALCRMEVQTLVPGKYGFKNKGLCKSCVEMELPAVCSKCQDARPNVGWFIRWFHPAYLFGVETSDLYCIRHTCLSSPDYVSGKKAKVLCSSVNSGGTCRYFKVS